MLGLASFAALCLVVFGRQGWLAMRLARRRPHWSRWKSAGLAALVVPVLLVGCIMVAVFVMADERTIAIPGPLDIFAMVVAFLLWAGVIWLIGAAIAWGLLAWKRLPYSPKAIAETFE